MMKFVAASDLHGDMFMTQKFAKAAVNLQASGIIIAGDVGPTVEKVITSLAKLKLPIYTVLGNDDFAFEEQALERIPYAININGESVDIGPAEIIGLSGSPGLGKLALDEGEIYNVLEKAFLSASKPVILVSHIPPYSVLDLATYHETDHVGSWSLRKIIEKYQPLVCLCGHVHKDGGKREWVKKTEVVNIAALADDEVSKSHGRRFAVIEICDDRKCKVSFDYLIDANMQIDKFIAKYV
jgi:Icc-related predicted phosphoesterase